MLLTRSGFGDPLQASAGTDETLNLAADNLRVRQREPLVHVLIYGLCQVINGQAGLQQSSETIVPSRFPSLKTLAAVWDVADSPEGL